MEIVLYQPQIPQNTGNIIRTCSVTGASLSLIEPIHFDMSDKMMRRAGLDYGKEVEIKKYPSLEAFIEQTNTPFCFLSSHATQHYTDCIFSNDHTIIFGNETSGLPSYIWEKWPELCYRIPMLPKKRCLNLSNAAAIVLYEGLRQQGFASFS